MTKTSVLLPEWDCESGNRDAISIDGNLLPRLLGKLITFPIITHFTNWVTM